MAKQRSIKAKRIVADIRARLTDFELTAKYELSSDELRKVLQILVQAGVIRPAEVDERGAWFDDPVNRNLTRAVPRHYLRIAPSIHDLDDPANKGLVSDISDHGFRVLGIAGKVGTEKRFVIHASVVADVSDVEVRATCRWCNSDPSDGGLHEAGYRIDQVTKEGVNAIKKLIKVFSLGDRNVRR
jgi:hypothetical protein